MQDNFLLNQKRELKKNMEEGRGFRLMDNIGKKSGGSAEFEFASSNELWRASLIQLILCL